MSQIIRELIFDELDNNFQDVVLIESAFYETSRCGKIMQLLRIALTSRALIIASKKTKTTTISKEDFQLRSLYPLECVVLSVFKCTRRQTLKACLCNNNVRYFQPAENKKMIYWDLWCMNIYELNQKPLKWPYNLPHKQLKFQRVNKNAIYNHRWTDKHLYLGAKRQIEDNDRPKPVPGLGSPNDIVKHIIFEETEQDQNMPVQSIACEYDVFTYSGGPTCNVVYTSYLSREKAQH